MSICLGLLGFFGTELLDQIELNELLGFLALPEYLEPPDPLGFLALPEYLEPLEPLEFLELLGVLVFNTFLFC